MRRNIPGMKVVFSRNRTDPCARKKYLSADNYTVNAMKLLTKKTFSRHLAALLCAALFLSVVGACQKPAKPGEEGQGGGQQQPPVPTGPYFKADLPDEYLMSFNQGAVSWPVDTDITDWTATSDADWCKPTAKAKELWLDVEDYDCRDENDAYKYDPPRICTVTVKAGTVFSKTIKIVQDTHTFISFTQLRYSLNYDWILDEPSGMKVLLSADGQTRDLMISSNAYRWVPETEATWLKVKCVDNATLRLTSTARADTETAPRSATVKLYVETDRLNTANFTVEDAPASVEGNDFSYGDHTDWD